MILSNEFNIGKYTFEYAFRNNYIGLGLAFFTTSPIFIEIQVGPFTIWFRRDR